MTTRTFYLSKSRIAAFEQCPKRLWLMTHNPSVGEQAEGTEARFATGNDVGAEACRQCEGGIMIEAVPNLSAAIVATRELIERGHRGPVFEATFQHEGVLVRVDVLEPAEGGWRMAEVKSSTKAKPEHARDLATQVWVVTGAGVPIVSSMIRHLDREFVLEREGDLIGLFADTDLSDEIAPLVAQRGDVAAKARTMLSEAEPVLDVGGHCKAPYPCEFTDHCHKYIPAGPEWPVTILPNRGGERFIAAGIENLTEVDFADLRNETHRRIHRATLGGVIEHDANGAAAEIANWAYPRTWLDFETMMHAIPQWVGCWPYRQVPFQFVAQIEQADGSIQQQDFLHLDGTDPRRACAEALARLPAKGAVIAWFMTFEKSRILELADDFPDLARRLRSLADRLVDLLPVARNYWYHRDQRGSWSIKAVLPTIAPELDYGDLVIGDGGAPQSAYLEAVQADPERRAEIATALQVYCTRDVDAMRVIARRLITA